MTDPVIKTLMVAASADRAFEVFVHRISSWWPLDGHAVSVASGKAAKSVTIEPREGGAVYETMYDGNRADWGTVLDYQPGRKLAMTWHPGTNKDNPTRLDVAFRPLDDGSCQVTLTHSGWEIWADRADDMRGSYDKGWDNVCARFCGAV